MEKSKEEFLREERAKRTEEAKNMMVFTNLREKLQEILTKGGLNEKGIKIVMEMFDKKKRAQAKLFFEKLQKYNSNFYQLCVQANMIIQDGCFWEFVNFKGENASKNLYHLKNNLPFLFCKTNIMGLDFKKFVIDNNRNIKMVVKDLYLHYLVKHNIYFWQLCACCPEKLHKAEFFCAEKTRGFLDGKYSTCLKFDWVMKCGYHDDKTPFPEYTEMLEKYKK